MRISTHVVGPVFTNCYFLQDEGTGETAIIDPGEFTLEMKEQVDRIGTDKIKYILLTHCHFDHILGAAALHEYTGAPVAIHSDDAKALGSPEMNGMRSFFISDGELPEADIIFSEGDSFAVGDLTVSVMHTPGHSQGSCCFICGDVMFCGDTLFRGSAGRTDLPGGSWRQLSDSLEKIAGLKTDYQLYPGHYDRTKLSEELATNMYLADFK